MPKSTEASEQKLQLSFGKRFFKDYAGKMVKDPKIALVELIANCWDAGADEVNITWPKVDKPGKIIIEDNGTGMTYEEFGQRWNRFNYNRRISQGEDVQFPPENKKSNRKAFGRNGKGRHSVFCFASTYHVETWRDGTANKFLVEGGNQTTTMPYTVTHVQQISKLGHGTIVSTELARNHLSIAKLRELIGSKFVTDPSFNVYVNGKLVELTDLKHLIDTQEINIPNEGIVKVSQIDTKVGSRRSDLHGIAWWVNKRLVGEPSWKGFDDVAYLDRRMSEAHRYTFVVEADILTDDVEEDWSGFKDTQKSNIVHKEVQKHIKDRIKTLMQDVHKVRKEAALTQHRKKLANLSSESRYYIGKTIDGIQNEIPSIEDRVLSATVGVLTNLENARHGRDLLEQLASLKPHELDELHSILAKWSVQQARIVLSELEMRLELINRLEELVDDPTSDELHDIHPLFEQGLWIFGPEYESVEFISNRSLLTIIEKFFKDKIESPLVNSRKRPDLVALPNSSLGIYASDSYQDSIVSGFATILIIELKRGGSYIKLDEFQQAQKYAHELRKSGKVQQWTNINVFVLGSKVEQGLEDNTQGKTRIMSRDYGTIIRQAKARTFNLLEKIKKVKKARSEDLLDPEVEKVLEKPIQGSLFN